MFTFSLFRVLLNVNNKISNKKVKLWDLLLVV